MNPLNGINLRITHNAFLEKLYRIQLKSNAKIDGWSLHYTPGKEPEVKITIADDKARKFQWVTIPISDFLRYEDDENIIFGFRRPPLDMGVEKTSDPNNPFYPK